MKEIDLTELTDRDKFVIEKTREYDRQQLHTKIKEWVLINSNTVEEGKFVWTDDLLQELDNIMEER